MQILQIAEITQILGYKQQKDAGNSKESEESEESELSSSGCRLKINVSSTKFISVNQRVSSSPPLSERAGGSVVHAKGGITHSSGPLDHLHQLREGAELQQLNFVELTLF